MNDDDSDWCGVYSASQILSLDLGRVGVTGTGEEEKREVNKIISTCCKTVD